VRRSAPAPVGALLPSFFEGSGRRRRAAGALPKPGDGAWLFDNRIRNVGRNKRREAERIAPRARRSALRLLRPTAQNPLNPPPFRSGMRASDLGGDDAQIDSRLALLRMPAGARRDGADAV